MELTLKQINQLERGVVQVFRSTMGWGARKATFYIGKNLVVRATRRAKPDGRAKRVEMVLTYGAPNFVERRFIRLCRAGNVKLPTKVQVKWWPKKGGGASDNLKTAQTPRQTHRRRPRTKDRGHQ